MAGSLNKVCIIGHLGKDPEIRTTQSGKKIANLTVATSESWKDKNTGERQERTEWHRVSIMNDALAGVAQSYLAKGSKVYLEGQLQTRKWTDRDGVERYTTEVVLSGYNCSLVMLDSKEKSESREMGYDRPYSRESAYQSSAALDDEIPF